MDPVTTCYTLLLFSLVLVGPTNGVYVTQNRVTFRSEPHGDLVVPLGSSSRLLCQAVDQDGRELPVRWLHNGTQIAADERILQLRDVRWSDQGVYQCAVDIAQGTVLSSGANLAVERPPRLVLHPAGVSVRLGGVVRFECAASATPPASYRWLHHSLPLDATNNSRLRILDSGQLQIVYIEPSDEGPYLCVASNRAGNITSRPAILSTSRPQPPPDSQEIPPVALKVLAVPQNVSVPVGQEAVFECMFDGPPTLKVRWKRLDGSLNAARAKIVGHNLMIRDVTVWDAGLYACIAKEKQGAKEVKLKANLFVNYPPKIVELPKDGSKSRGLAHRFVCVSDASPPPEISWFKNGRPIAAHARYKFFPDVKQPVSMMRSKTGEVFFKRDLLVSSMQEEDQGFYQCFVSNSMGSVSAAAVLNVKKHHNPNASSEGAPYNLIGEQEPLSREFGVLLEWDAPPNMTVQQITTYLIHFYETVGGKENAVVQACLERHCSVSCCGAAVGQSLKPYTNYTFYVNAVARDTPDSLLWVTPNSNSVIVQTADGPATRSAPLTVTGLHGGNVRMEWETLDDTRHVPGELQGFKLQYKREDELGPHEKQFPPFVLEHTLQGLLPNSTYFFRVIPRTRFIQNDGYPSVARLSVLRNFPWVSHWLPPVEQDQLLAPDLDVRVLSNRSLELSWTLADQNPVSGFQIKYHIESGGDTQIVTVGADRTTVIIGPLEPNKVYEISIAAVSPSGKVGLESSRTAKTKKLAVKTIEQDIVIEPPQELECDTSDGHLTVRWLKPPSNRNIIRYEVRITPTPSNGQALNSSYVRRIQVDTQYISPSNLEPGRLYYFAVRSFDDWTYSGPFSVDVPCLTLPAPVLPGPPRDVRLRPINSTFVEVWWTPPKNASQLHLVFYVLFYTDTPGKEPWDQIRINASESSALLNVSRAQVYFIKVAAESASGRGPSSTVVVSSRHGPPTTSTQRPVIVRVSYKEGIIIGVCIAVVCVVICAFILIRRIRRENSSSSSWGWWPCSSSGDGSSAVKSNGHTIPNGHVLSNGHAVVASDAVEMQTLLPPIGENMQCDSKGGPDGARPRGCSRVSAATVNEPPDHKGETELDPLVLHVRGEGGSEQSPSPLTATSLHSWSLEERISHPATSSLPNLTDSGIGLDGPSQLNGAPPRTTCWCRSAGLHSTAPRQNRWGHASA